MSSAAKYLPVTAVEYLEGELRSEVRHEFVDGRTYAMSGDSRIENEICSDIYVLIREHLRGQTGRAYCKAVKVQLADDRGEAYYPDVFITGQPSDDDSHIVRDPKLIIEVLSQSTSRIDRTDKLMNYQRNPSVEEIVLIEQGWPEFLVFRRSDGWKRHLHTQFETLIRFESIGFSAPLSAFYQSNPFPQDVERPWYHLNRVEN